MKKLFLLFFATAAMTLVSCGGSLSEGSSDSEKQSQEEMAANAELPKEAADNAVVDWGDDVFKSAATMPSFPGGNGALMSYINKYVKYPQSAQDANIQGKVVVQFVVEKDGHVGEVKVARSLDKDLDQEAIRVCKSLPKFNPGKDASGEPVRVVYTLPVTFKPQNGGMSEAPVADAVASESATCSKCGGSGKVSCSKCGGRGVIYSHYPGTEVEVDYGCKKCGGSGSAASDGGHLRKGKGHITCPECHGTGKI
ncbi:MAG: TonB family protein [Muribaculaceae bacterium]|nr:TonB family protein [Muribaculaceae bacterium]